MAIAAYLKEIMLSPDSSVIRKMFEEGSVLKQKYGADAVFDFSLGNPDVPPVRQVLESIQRIASENTSGIHGYMSNAGYVQTRDAIASKVSGEQQSSLSGEYVVMTSGAASALNCVFKAVLSPGDEVIVPAPFFSEYRHYVSNFGGKLVPVLCSADFSLNIDTIAESLSDKTAAVLINSPNNPTGRVYSLNEMEHLAALLKEHGRKTGRYPYLICDEPYRAIVYRGCVVPSVFPLYKNSIIVSSFAKDLSLAGERIGYIAVNPDCEDAGEMVLACVFALRTLGFVNANAFFQRVIAECWSCTVDISLYEQRGNLLMAVLDRTGIEYARPDGAFYLFCRVPPRNAAVSVGDDSAFCEHLKNNLILCAPGTGFGCPGWFRMSYCVAEQTIVRCETALNAAVKSWKAEQM